MEIDHYTFGYIRIAGRDYDADVIISTPPSARFKTLRQGEHIASVRGFSP